MSQSISNESLQNLRPQVVAKSFASGNSFYINSAQGAKIIDEDGNEYIDFSGGIAVMNVGHSQPKVVDAIKKQADKFTHSCFMVVPYGSAVNLADRLCELVPGSFPKSAIFINSGAEAVENAVKIVRYASKRNSIIAFEGGFHGRTLLGMSLTSKLKPYKFGFEPYAPEIYKMPFAYCYRCPFDRKYPDCDTYCAEYLNHFFINYIAPEQVAAIIVEPIQGEGGFITPPPNYFKKLSDICRKNEILFIADEIQTGIGRTGKMFAMEHYGVQADLTTVAKSLAAGMPISSVVGRKELMDAVHPGGVGGTYGGNPVCCEAALAVLDIFEEENLLEKADILGTKVRNRFDSWQKQYEIIGDVRGLGPMLALELVKDRETKVPAADEARKLVAFCAEKGLIILSCGTFGNVIRLLMPLVINDEELERGLAIMEEGLSVI